MEGGPVEVQGPEIFDSPLEFLPMPYLSLYHFHEKDNPVSPPRDKASSKETWLSSSSALRCLWQALSKASVSSSSSGSAPFSRVLLLPPLPLSILERHPPTAARFCLSACWRRTKNITKGDSVSERRGSFCKIRWHCDVQALNIFIQKKI